MHWSDYPTGWPVFETPDPPADLDNDGIADSWEAIEGLDTTADDSALDKDGDGYTNIEEYLFYLAEYAAVPADRDDPGDGGDGTGSGCFLGQLMATH